MTIRGKRHATRLAAILAMATLSCSRTIWRSDLMVHKNVDQMRSARGVPVLGFVKADGARVGWRGRVFLDSRGNFVFSHHEAATDSPPEWNTSSVTIPADSLGAIIERDPWATTAAAVGVLGAVVVIGTAVLIHVALSSL